ncbi:carboxypeptidase-like regulatory domain-containing protein [Candidatus Kaiserbacteria bacterium]|nr:carboxypeptidase-like regulatory domain-containing protein [Candidatus Kaiserbacteria bacterium]
MVRPSSAGVTLIDTVVGTALMLLIFMGVAAAFQLSIDVVTSNKARAGAIALLNERMEYIHSLTYSAIGTSGGIPSGALAQNETVMLNGVTYNRRTLIVYYDDSKDGSGGGDANTIQADSKVFKVDVSWTSRTGTRHITASARVAPLTGLESAVSGGTLTINAVDSLGAPISSAQVTVVNAGTSVNLITYTNASGTIQFVGTPASAGYQISVTKSGYSTAQTYSATAQNTSPNPGHLTVTNNVTTSATFAVDVLGNKTVRTWTPVQTGTTTDTYADSSKIATSSNVSVASGVAAISAPAPYGTGLLQSTAVAPSYLYGWKLLTWTDSKPAGTSIVYRVYDFGGSALIPDSQLPGNAAGFTASPVNLSGISTSTYTGLRIGATLTGSASATPSIDTWSLGYDYGPIPLPNIAFTLTGSKTIGSGPSGTVYKYSQSLNTGAGASLYIPNIEWDTYTIAVASSTGYDISKSCNPQPETLSPGSSVTTDLYLSAHTASSLLVDVRSAATGALLPNASVQLTKTGYNATVSTGSCGQAFFSGLTNATYTIVVSLAGYTTYTGTNAAVVNGTTKYSVSLN